MIVGLGSDICNIKRIEDAYCRFGQRFVRRCFGELELSELAQMENESARLVASLAKRFAAKEAFVKALGTGFTQGIAWSEIEVVHQQNGCPIFQISGQAESILLTKGKDARVWLSLSDDYPYAQAVVVIENN